MVLYEFRLCFIRFTWSHGHFYASSPIKDRKGRVGSPFIIVKNPKHPVASSLPTGQRIPTLGRCLFPGSNALDEPSPLPPPGARLLPCLHLTARHGLCLPLSWRAAWARGAVNGGAAGRVPIEGASGCGRRPSGPGSCPCGKARCRPGPGGVPSGSLQRALERSPVPGPSKVLTGTPRHQIQHHGAPVCGRVKVVALISRVSRANPPTPPAHTPDAPRKARTPCHNPISSLPLAFRVPNRPEAKPEDGTASSLTSTSA